MFHTVTDECFANSKKLNIALSNIQNYTFHAYEIYNYAITNKRFTYNEKVEY